MCFTKKLKIPIIPKPLKATKDIVVYKAINKDGDGWLYDLIIDDNKEPWTKGFEYIETDPFDASVDRDGNLCIEGRCFHSYGSRKDLEHNFLLCHGDIIVKMIIPKGALYYVSDGHYVSNRIIYP